MSTIVTLEGNLAADPELRYTPAGKAVASFSLPVSERRKNSTTGEWEDASTSWYRVDVWNQQGLNVAESLHKGDRVLVTGVLRMRGFDREDGCKSTAAEVTASTVAVALRWATASVVRNGSGSHAA